ncbi:hypothetical protein EEL32_09990 [Brevibacillus laterosporus]|nr:hypothetical protein [Brevibacillus laterosporus]TPG69751.1 hypothetical protein EEL31_15490 [Brevibacillus laterosporus]TPG88462.1 hypothetical protein EEL32_09990 [Brevibacillus laterosporus]
MKKMASALALSLVLGTTSLVGANSALATEKNPIDLGEIRVGERDNLNQEKLDNLTDEEKTQIVEEHILKNGKLIQALDSKEIEKAMNTIQSEGNERFVFEDGSSISINTGAETTSSQTLVPNKSDSTSSKTAKVDYLIESWTGLDLAEYTLYQDFKYDGKKVKSWSTPYSKYWALPVISQWQLVSENYNTDTDAVTTGGSKFRFGLWEIATFQTISVKGTLELYKDGTYKGWFKTL